MAKGYMDANNIKYTDYDVSTDLEKRKEMVDRSGQMGVPVIDIDGKIMVGFEEESFKAELAK